MKRFLMHRVAATLWAVIVLAGLPVRLLAQLPAVTNAVRTNGVSLIDLPTALRLAGANNLDVRIARAQLAEARANQESATWQFFPWLAPGFAYRAHDNAIQNVEGEIIDVHRDSYTLGPALRVQAATEKLATVRRGQAAAEEAFRLARERKEFGVGVVLDRPSRN